MNWLHISNFQINKGRRYTTKSEFIETDRTVVRQSHSRLVVLVLLAKRFAMCTSEVEKVSILPTPDGESLWNVSWVSKNHFIFSKPYVNPLHFVFLHFYLIETYASAPFGLRFMRHKNSCLDSSSKFTDLSRGASSIRRKKVGRK